MSRLLKLAVPIFSVCFSLSVSAARPQLPPAWDGSSVRFDSRTYGYMPPVRIVAQEQADLISGGDLLLEAGNGQADLQNARICVLRSRDGRRPGLLLDFGRELQGGLADPEATDRDYISKDGSNGFSTFYGYYMLRAMAAAGNYEGALVRIREYWGAMLDLGATTFWEDFDMAWLPAARIDEPVPAGMRDLHRECGAYCYKGFRHSLCHGWASGPTAWLTEYVLGVEVVEPGCRRLRIDPHLGDLEWVEGTFPTPYGAVKIRHEKAPDGTVKSRVEAPRGVKTELVKHNG